MSSATVVITALTFTAGQKATALSTYRTDIENLRKAAIQSIADASEACTNLTVALDTGNKTAVDAVIATLTP